MLVLPNVAFQPVDHRSMLLDFHIVFVDPIGVIYHPETEFESHYFEARLPSQFDELIWFDKTSAVTPFKTHELEGMPDTYPFGL
jgi:erythromycin esterase-like protein